MSTTADLTFRLNGEDINDITIKRGESVDLELYLQGGADFVGWADINSDPSLTWDDARFGDFHSFC